MLGLSDERILSIWFSFLWLILYDLRYGVVFEKVYFLISVKLLFSLGVLINVMFFSFFLVFFVFCFMFFNFVDEFIYSCFKVFVGVLLFVLLIFFIDCNVIFGRVMFDVVNFKLEFLWWCSLLLECVLEKEMEWCKEWIGLGLGRGVEVVILFVVGVCGEIMLWWIWCKCEWYLRNIMGRVCGFIC